MAYSQLNILAPEFQQKISDTWYKFRDVQYVKVAVLVKNLPVMRKTWVWSLSQEDPLEEQMVTHSSNLA